MSRVAFEHPAAQLDLMSRTSVLITPSGGLGTVAMFLQPGATAIVFNFWADTRSTSEQQENIMSWCAPSPDPHASALDTLMAAT